MKSWKDVTTCWLVASERGHPGECHGTICATRDEAVNHAKRQAASLHFGFRVYRVVFEGTAHEADAVYVPVSEKTSVSE